MTRAQVQSRLPSMPAQMRRMVEALLIREQTAVQLSNLYCLSYRTQLSKARAFHDVPVIGEPTPGKPYYTYRLDLDDTIAEAVTEDIP